MLIAYPPAGLSDALAAVVHSQSCLPDDVASQEGTQQSQPASQAKHVSLCVAHGVEPKQPPWHSDWCGSGWMAVRLVILFALAAVNLHGDNSHPQHGFDCKSCRISDLAPLFR